MRGWVISAVAGAWAAFAHAGFALAGPEVKIGDNVFLLPDPKAKVITLWMVVNAGCRDEEGGQCAGLAHYLEHLMFIGRDGKQEFNTAQVFAAGQTNAFTSMQATAYYQTAPAREGQVVADLEKLFDRYSERLRGIDIAEDAAARERNVVLQEFNFRKSDSVRRNFYTAMNKKLQPDHPISQPVIGSKEDIAAFSVEKAKAFHQRWYAKNNINFLVYGPVGADDVKALAAKYIDPLPRKKVPSRAWLDARRSFEPLDGLVSVNDPEAQRREVLLEKIVRYEDADPLQTGISNAILFDYLNSQIKGSLQDVFVENRRLVSQIHVSVTPIGAGAMWYSVAATLEDATTPEAMKAEIAAYFANLEKSGVEASVVERLKKRRASSNQEIDKDPQKSLSALQSWFSNNSSYADWLTRGERLAAVTAPGMAPVLKAMAGPGRQVFGVLTPQK